MFERFAAKGPGLFLGLVAALLPASSALAAPEKPAAEPASNVVKLKSRDGAGAPFEAKPFTKPTLGGLQNLKIPARGVTGGNAGSAGRALGLKVNTPAAKGGNTSSGASAKGPRTVPFTATIRLDGFKTSGSRGGGTSGGAITLPKPSGSGGGRGADDPGTDADHDITPGTYDAIEPEFLPRRPLINLPNNRGLVNTIVYSANPGGDAYPPAPDPEATEPDPPIPAQLPAFLVGVNDFSIYFSRGGLTTGSRISFGTDDNVRGEYFEPTVAVNQALGFSAFLNPTNDIYKPSDEINVGGEDITFDSHGFPVRTIGYSENAIAQSLDNGKAGQITKLLPPGLIGALQVMIPPADEGGEPESKWMPIFAPDANPVFYPLNSRFILFVSLRGYNPDDPATHYTSLWLWDTAKDNDDDGQVQQLMSLTDTEGNPLSILNPAFSPDGKYLAFTVSTQSFDNWDAENFYAPDPVFDTDVTKAALAQPFQSFVVVMPVSIPDPGDGIAGWNPGPFLPGSNFQDADGNFSRDMMPFFTDLNQLGFSSDRVDTDGDGVADAVQTDPAQASFSLYAFRYPFNPNNPALEDAPATSAQRLTLGAAETDTFNELNGSAMSIFQDLSLTGNDDPADYLTTPSVLYQSDATGDWDIWFTDVAEGKPFVYDGNLLLGLPQVTGNPDLSAADKLNLRKTHRVGMPGDFVDISVRLNPKYFPLNEETGEVDYTMAKLYALVKDPDNKIFVPYKSSQVTGTAWTTVYRESNAFPALITADDITNYVDKFGEAEAQPLIGALVPFTPDPNRVGYYTARWYTPLEVSDFLLDIKLDRGPDAAAVYSDNIGGFSTSPFVAASSTLLVSDFTAGQRAVPYTTNVPGTEAVPTESYVTVRPHPDSASPDKTGPELPILSLLYGSIPPFPAELWAVLGPRIEFQDVPTLTVDPLTGRLEAADDATLNENNPMSALPEALSPGANFYDLWRTQCRPPITLNDVGDSTGTTILTYGVLKNYLPYTHSAPGYPNPNLPRTQTVADRHVLWVAPHAGNLNGNAGANATEVGTIANVTTQDELVRYIQRGGRIAISGEDVAFTLAQKNPQTNNALLNALRVRFETDADPDITHVYHFNRLAVDPVHPSGLNGLNPIPFATWEVHYPLVNQPAPTDLVMAAPFDWDMSFSSRSGNRRNDGAPINYRPDSITGIGVDVIGGAYPFYTYKNSENPETGADEQNVRIAAIMSHAPYPTSNTSSRKTVFFGFSIEGVDRDYIGPLTDADMGDRQHYHAVNPLAGMIHNTVDWLTTTTIQGKVFITNDVATPEGVLVYAVDDWNAEANGRVMSTTVTDAEGNYVLDGLDSSIYLLYAYKTGYTMQHDVRQDADLIRNNLGVTTNLTLIPAPPGSLTGVVRDKETDKPLPGVPVTATDIQKAFPPVTVITDAQGRYNFPVLQAGLYILTTPELTNQPPDGKDYGASSTEANPVNVPSNGTGSYTIYLTAPVVQPKPATIIVNVFDAESGTSVPATGAKVTLTDSTGKVAATLDLGDNPVTVGEDGQAVFHVNSGVYTATVTYSKLVGTNEKVFRPQSKSVTAVPDEDAPEGTTIEFVFGGVLHTFAPNKILMASAPYDYTGSNFATVLGIPDANALTKAIVAYNEAKQDFTFFPTYPADTFHLGRGYGFKLPQEGRVSEQGTAAPVQGQFYPVRAEIGWNLIATPFTAPSAWTKAAGASTVKFALRDDPKQTLHDVDDTNDPVTLSNILGVLWGPTDPNTGEYTNAYASAVSVMQPWQAYWIKVAQPTIFYFPRPTAPKAAAASMAAKATAARIGAPNLLMPRADVWGVNITASSGDYADRGLALGIHRAATSGQDLGLDMEKPAPMSGSGPMLYTAFPRSNGALDAADVRGPGANTWTFTVKTNLAAEPVTLTWTPSGNLPAGSTATLVDVETGRRVNMGAASEYTFRSGAKGGDRAFRVEVR